MATFNPQTFLKQVGSGKTTLTSPKKQTLFSQGDTTDQLSGLSYSVHAECDGTGGALAASDLYCVRK
jgi:hypothetical protein